MTNRHSLSRLKRIDWDFDGVQSESPFSSIHWHPGRFMSQIPGVIIGHLSNKGDVVFDPFAGSGTTLVEAQKLERKSIGVELNPISCKIMRGKTISVKASTISKSIALVQNIAVKAFTQSSAFSSRIDVPSTVQNSKWYTRNTLNSLRILWGALSTLETERDKLIGELAFSALLLAACRETRHWGYICDNTEPKTYREINVLAYFLRNLKKIEVAYKDRDNFLSRKFGKNWKVQSSLVIQGDAKQKLTEIEPNSIDLIITSPPYYGVVDYIKAQRLSMEWFGLNIEDNRLREVGARSKRHRKKAKEDYLREMGLVLTESAKVLKEGSFLVLVIGESLKRKAVCEEMIETLESSEFTVLMEIKRRVSAQRRQTPSINHERIVIAQVKSL